MKNIKIFPASLEDEEFVENLTNLVMREYVEELWDKDHDRTRYFSINGFNKNTTEIIYSDNKQIGRITIEEIDERVEIMDIHIVPEFQSKGIGSFLIKKILKNYCKNKSFVQLKVLENNPAQRLYKRLGFEIYKRDNNRLYMNFNCKKYVENS